VRSGTPGRALGKPQKLGSTTTWSAAMAPDGRTLIAFGRGRNGDGQINVARGRAGARFLNARRLSPRTSTIVWDVAAAIDSAGRSLQLPTATRVAGFRAWLKARLELMGEVAMAIGGRDTAHVRAKLRNEGITVVVIDPQ